MTVIRLPWISALVEIVMRIDKQPQHEERGWQTCIGECLDAAQGGLVLLNLANLFYGNTA